MSAASGPSRTVKLKVTLKFDKMSESLTFLCLCIVFSPSFLSSKQVLLFSRTRTSSPTRLSMLGCAKERLILP